MPAQQLPPLLARPDAEGGYPSGRPFPNGATARDGKQSLAIVRSWLERVFVAPCRQANPQNAALIDYVTTGCKFLGGGGAELEPQLSARAGEIERSGVRDAGFCFFAGLVSHDVIYRERRFREAISAFPGSGYPPFVQFVAASCLAKSVADRRAPQVEQDAADQTALQALRSGLTKHSVLPHGRAEPTGWALGVTDQGQAIWEETSAPRPSTSRAHGIKR